MPTGELAREDVRFLRDACGDLRQFASARSITLDEGAERGVRAVACSSGGGLDVWVLSDRTMDLGPAWFQGRPIAWQHPCGFVSPALHDARADGGLGLERALSGLLVTCGLDNVRQPSGGAPLHGTLPFTPARILAVEERWEDDRPHLRLEGVMTRASLVHGGFQLRRRIMIPIGGTRIDIDDTIENVGPAPASMRILYHVNLGYPTINSDTRVEIGARHDEPLEFAGGEPHCHDVPADALFHARVTRPARPGDVGFSLTLRGSSFELPYVQLWADRRPRRHLLALEPTNCARRADGTSGPGAVLAPGERWHARLSLEIGVGPDL